MTQKLTAVLARIALGFGVSATAPAWAAGGSFACQSDPTKETREHVGGSFALQSIVVQYMTRWDAQEAMEQCRAYAEGRPYEISCLNGRRDWDAIIASVPKDYFGQSNESLAKTVDQERRTGNRFADAMAYCRSVGAIK